MDNKQEKQQAVLTVAKAFYDRGVYLQYDQRCMDRMLQLTQRRQKFLPPEASNSQYIHFLDCSGFTSAVYLTAFNYELPSDLTWLMIDQMEAPIFYYELTHEETLEEIHAIQNRIRQMLEPGDLITYEQHSGTGHIMLYLGNNCYSDCSFPFGEKNSYNYEENKNQLYEQGIWRKSMDLLLPWEEQEIQNGHRSLFNPKKRRFSIHRPLDVIQNINEQTKIRMTQAKDLWCAVENSAPACYQAYPGQTVEYTVIIRNLGEIDRNVTVCFENPVGTSFSGEKTVSCSVKAGEETRVPFTVTVDADNQNAKLDGPVVTVNELLVYAHQVLLGRQMEEKDLQAISCAVAQEMQAGATAVEAASKAYAPYGIKLDPREKPYSWSHFLYHDSPACHVLSRRPQKPFTDLAVYGGFGGRGVITPEITLVQGVRMTHITRADLQLGDVLLCFDDPLGNVTYSSFYDGEALIGRFSPEDENHVIRDAELDRFVDSLFGRFAFILLRPRQGKK